MDTPRRFRSRTILYPIALLALASPLMAPTTAAAAPVVRPGHPVRWQGGPLDGLSPQTCVPDACVDFAVEVRIPARRDRDPYLQVSLESGHLNRISLLVRPPGSAAEQFSTHTSGVARVLHPRPGRWVIRVTCHGAVITPTTRAVAPCEDTRFGGLAFAGTLPLAPGAAHRAGARRVAVARAPTTRTTSIGDNAFEPTLGVTRSGSIFFQAFNRVRRSTDRGMSWTEVSPRAGPLRRHPTTNDPYIYVDPATSRIFTVDYMLATVLCSELSFSDDRGANWTTAPACGHTDHQTVFAGPAVTSAPIGYPHLVYYCAATGGVGGLSSATTCSKSLDGGMTFVPTGGAAFLVARDAQVDLSCNGLTGHGVVAPDGSMYLPRGWCGRPYIGISRDEGLTWSRVRVADVFMSFESDGGFAHEAGVAVDANGTLYYTFVGGDELPYLSVSRTRGRTWSAPMMIAPPGVVAARLPAIDVGAPGKVAIAYLGTRGGSEGFNGYITASADARVRDPLFYSAATNHPSDPLTIERCGITRCETLGDFFDVVVAPDGTAWASFVDGCVARRCLKYGFGVGIVSRMVGGPRLR